MPNNKLHSCCMYEFGVLETNHGLEICRISNLGGYILLYAISLRLHIVGTLLGNNSLSSKSLPKECPKNALRVIWNSSIG